MADDKKPQEEHKLTTKLDIIERQIIVVPGLGRFGLQFAEREVKYHSVPFKFKTVEQPPSWRIHLKFGAPTPHTTVGLDMFADVILGRGKDGDSPPDVDLTELDALKQGVSRRHALLRPTPTKLFLMDMGSTNGTFLNAMPVGQGMAKVVNSGDLISLGDLAFTIEIILQPPPTEVKPPEKPAQPQ